ncbi:MAG: metallopeptidase family protein [Clostridiales bacterium]|nr:metallopeptidase family protein [Clostridiales bacterium]
MTIDEMQDVLDELAEELPEAFYRDLNGGIVLLPEARESEYTQRPGDLYTLGEYHRGGGLGNYIKIYYGSFERIFGTLSDEAMKMELRKTLRHEFRHHLENLAGEDGLEIEDEIYLRNYLESRGAIKGRRKKPMPKL